MPSVSVIGSGIGGLSIAIRLAVKGYQVDVFEKNEGPGGKLSVIRDGDYVFDAGPSLFTQPSNLEELFILAGKEIGDYFRYRSVDIACRYFFGNGRKIDAFTRAEDFAREMQAVAGEDPNAVLEYLRRSGQVYEGVGTIFLNYSLHKASTWLHPTPRLLPSSRPVAGRRPSGPARTAAAAAAPWGTPATRRAARWGRPTAGRSPCAPGRSGPRSRGRRGSRRASRCA